MTAAADRPGDGPAVASPGGVRQAGAAGDVPGLPPARPGAGLALASLTTLAVGGPAERTLVARTADDVVAAVRAADAADRPVLVLGGGSNVLVADDPLPGDVVAVRSTGVVAGAATADTATAHGPVGPDHVVWTVAAGEPWDAVVAASVAEGLAGLEALSGIPGATGATPIQNVGAYGQEVADTIVGVRALDRETGEVVELSPAACRFAYRDSALKGSDRHVVLAVRFALERSPAGRPVRYGELARTLGAGPGDRPPAAEVREAVLALRRGKGMVLDPRDPDTRSAGSFFTNPILDDAAFADLASRVRERVGPDAEPPAYPGGEGRTKTSAAWLIERAGFPRGHARDGAAISSKHTLALTSRGGTAADVLALAREVSGGVRDAFGVDLRPEPVLVGWSW